MTQMRKKIAEHMVFSRRTSRTSHRICSRFSRSDERLHREKNRFEQEENTKLTLMPFFIRALI